MTKQKLGYTQSKAMINSGNPVIITTANDKKLGIYEESNDGSVILNPVYLRDSKGIYVPGEHIKITQYFAIQKITPKRLDEIITNSKPPYLPHENQNVNIRTSNVNAIGTLSKIRQNSLILQPYILQTLNHKHAIDTKGQRVISTRQDYQVTPLEEPLENIVEKLNKQRVIE